MVKTVVLYTFVMNILELLLLFIIISLPLIVGYWRGLDHWTMTKIWLWFGCLPVIGWFVALFIAFSADHDKS